MRRRRTSVALLTALATLLAGCSSGEEFEFRGADVAATTGGTLRAAIPEPASVDPGNAFDEPSRLVVQTMCDPLIGTDPDTGELVPAIAESWIVSDDGDTFTLRLRKDAVFSNGQTVTADDVAYTLTRVASAEYASELSDLLRPVLGFEFVHGDTFTEEIEQLNKLDGVTVIERHSVEISLGESNADWIRALTHPALSPVPRALAIEHPGPFERRPVCAGPYELEQSWEPGASEFALVRTEHHVPMNGALTAGGSGFADRIEFLVVGSREDGLAAYEAGRVDVAEVSMDDLPQTRRRFVDDLVEVPGAGMSYVGFPVTDEQFNDPAVRRAFSLAVDRDHLTRRLYNGSRSPATGFLPPVLGSDLAGDCSALVPKANSKAALDLLAEAGIRADGLAVSVIVNDDDHAVELVEELARQWRQHLGIEVEVVTENWADYVARGNSSDVFSGPFRFSWEPLYAASDQYIAPLFTTDGIGSANFSQWTRPSFDQAIIRSARRIPAEVDRILEYGRLADEICEAMPMAPLVTDDDQYLVRRSAVGAAGDTVTQTGLGGLALRELYVLPSAG